VIKNNLKEKNKMAEKTKTKKISKINLEEIEIFNSIFYMATDLMKNTF
jgi:hypothetical protein